MRLWVKVLVSQAWMQSEVAIQKQYNNGKKNRGGRGVKDIEFSGVLEKWQVDFPGG